MKDGGPAFPTIQRLSPSGQPIEPVGDGGMSLRDWFAGQALAVILEKAFDLTERGSDPAPWAAVSAYDMADAMLAEREKAK